jgi:hypothetical protein
VTPKAALRAIADNKLPCRECGAVHRWRCSVHGYVAGHDGHSHSCANEDCRASGTWEMDGHPYRRMDPWALAEMVLEG